MPTTKKTKTKKVKTKQKQKQKQTVKVVVNVNSNNKKRVMRDKKSIIGATPVNLPMTMIQRTPDQFLQPQQISINVNSKDGPSKDKEQPPQPPPPQPPPKSSPAPLSLPAPPQNFLTYGKGEQQQRSTAQSATPGTPTSQIDGTPPRPPSREGMHPLDPSGDFRTPVSVSERVKAFDSGVPFSFDERRASLNPVFSTEKEGDEPEGSASAQKREVLGVLGKAIQAKADERAKQERIKEELERINLQIKDAGIVTSKTSFETYQRKYKITVGNNVKNFTPWRKQTVKKLEQKKKDLLST